MPPHCSGQYILRSLEDSVQSNKVQAILYVN
jgi:hypothetical protein